MGKSLVLEVPDDLWLAMQDAARRAGRPVEVIAIDWLTGQAPKADVSTENNDDARSRFRRHFGAVNSGNPRSADNAKIDADLVRDYGGKPEVQP